MNRHDFYSLLKLAAVAIGGFLLCVGSGYVLNRITGAVWGIGVGIVFWIWLASLLKPAR